MRLFALLLLLAAPADADPGNVGTVGPTQVAAAAADGSWSVLCQARRDTDHDGVIAVRNEMNGASGDQQEAYLVRGSGAGIRIDDLIATDPAGERVVIARKHRLVMLQPGGAAELDLTKLGARSPQFDPTGTHLFYIRQRGKLTRIVVRDLATAAEIELDPGPGELDSAFATGAWLELSVFLHKPGDTKWVVLADSPPRRCWTGFLSDVETSSGTPPVTRWVPLAGGQARDVPDALGALGSSLVRRTGDGALVLEAADRTVTDLVPASCAGRVLAGDPEALSVVVACRGGDLYEYGRGRPRALGAKVPVPDGDNLVGGRFLFVSGNDGGSILIDTVTGATRETGRYQMRIAETGRFTVIHRGDRLVVLDGTQDRDLGAIERYPAILRAGRFLYVEPLVVDLDSGSLAGRAPTREVANETWTHPVRANVQAIANDGRLLVGFGGGRWDSTPGPLEWVQPAR